MDVVRAAALLVIVALGAALVVGLLSRAPAQVRNATPVPTEFDPALGAGFTEAQEARHDAYRRPQYGAFASQLLVTLVVAYVLAAGAFAEVVARLERWRGGWFTHALIAGALVMVLLWLALLPLSFMRSYVIEHAWDRSTQDFAGWFVDQLRSLAVGVVISAVAAGAFFAVVRWQPRSWWIWGAATFSLLSLLLAFVFPLLIAPLFFRFTPLPDGSLRARALALAREAGVPVDEVLVADASRRSTAQNAYVAGFGSSRQLVVYDTLLEAADEDETLFVIAHEVGHRARGHILKGVAWSALLLTIGFGALYLLLARTGLLSLAGASSAADLRVLPLLLAALTIGGVMALPLENALSRRHEREADAVAARLIEDPAAAVRAFRRLGLSNLADLDPDPVVELFLFTHPSIPERIRTISAGSSGTS